MSETTSPTRKDICNCGVLERASREPDHAIRWDESLNEYYIAHGKSGRMVVYYCPFCGGSTPKSRRSLLSHTLTDAERKRLCHLTTWAFRDGGRDVQACRRW